MKRTLRRLGAGAVGLALAGIAAAQNTNDPLLRSNTGKSDWEERQEELLRKENAATVKLPAYPKARGEGLIAFRVDGGSNFRFYIDPASVQVGEDRVVRYTLVAISPNGYENVTYEGIHCKSGEFRVYARGHEGRWSEERGGQWRPIEPRSIQRWHNELRRRYFCVHYAAAVLDTAEALDALRRGGHPMVTDSRFELQR